MADEMRMALEQLLRKADLEQDVDFLREGARVFSEALMELEVTRHVGAERHERTPERTGQRNGYREREWDTRVGTLELRVPRVRDGGYFPSLLDPRKRGVRALGIGGISKSQVSRLCQALDAEVERFRTRPLAGPYPYVWLDATYLKVRDQGRVVSRAVVIAVGVN